MSTDYQRFFGLRSLNARVELFAQDVTRTRTFQNKFAMNGRQLTARDGTLEWDEITFARGLAPVVGHKARFPNRAEMSKTVRRSAVMHIKLSKELDPYKLYFERLPGQLEPDARAYVELEMRDLVTEIANTLEYACAETLRGTFTCNASNIPGTTQVFTLSYSPNTYAKSAGWGTAGTGILSSEIPALKTDIEQTCGLAPSQAFCGNTIEGYFVGNTEISSFVQRALGKDFVVGSGTMRGPMFGGLEIGGLMWNVVEGGYVPSGGSFTRYLPTTDQAIVLPQDSELNGVLGMGLWRGMVPRSVLGPADSAAELAVPAPNLGWYAYATLEKDVPTIKIHVGFVGLPTLLRPDAVCVADTN